MRIILISVYLFMSLLFLWSAPCCCSLPRTTRIRGRSKEQSAVFLLLVFWALLRALGSYGLRHLYWNDPRKDGMSDPYIHFLLLPVNVCPRHVHNPRIFAFVMKLPKATVTHETMRTQNNTSHQYLFQLCNLRKIRAPVIMFQRSHYYETCC